MNLEIPAPRIAVDDSLQTLASVLPHLLWQYTPDGRIVYLNRGAEKIFGVAGEGWQGNEWVKAIHPDDQAMVMTLWQRSVATGTRYRAEFREWRNPDGWRRCLAQALPLHDESGAIVRWLGSTTDVEEIYATAESLRDAQAICRSALALLPHFFLLVDADGTIREASEAALAPFALTREAVIGSRADRLVEGLPGDLFAASAAERADPRHMAVKVRDANGVHTPVRLSLLWRTTTTGAAGFMFLGGGPEAFDTVALANARPAPQDVAELRFYRELLQNLPPLTWAASPAGWGEFANQRWVEYTGLSAAEIAGFGWIRAIHPDDRPLITKALTDISAKPKPWRVELRFRRHDGVYRRFDILAEPILDAHGNLVRWTGVNIDVEERYALLDSLNESKLRFGQLITQLPDSFLVFDAHARLLEANAKACETLGAPREALLGRSLDEFLAVGHHELFTLLDQGVRKGEPQRLVLRRSDGRDLPVSAVFGRQLNEGRFAYFVLARNLQQPEGMGGTHRTPGSTVDLTPLVICNLDGHVTLWSEGMERVLGFSSEEALDQPLHALLQTQPLQRLREMQRRLRSRGRWVGEVFVTSKEGAVETMRCHCVLAGGLESQRVIVNFEPQKEPGQHGEPAPSLQVARLAHGSVGEWRWDTARGQVRLDYAAQCLMGFKDPQIEVLLTNSETNALVWEEDRQRIIQQLSDAHQQQMPLETEFRVRIGNSFRWLLFRARPEPDGVRWKGLLVDVTARMEAREMLEASRRDLRAYASELDRTLEHERATIARELHDELGQRLTVMRLDLQRLGSSLNQDGAGGAKARAQIEALDASVQEALLQMRQLSAQLRPESMETLGLKSSILAHARRLGASSTLKIHLQIGHAERVPAHQRMTVFRVVQEALTNVLRHSGAQEASVRLRLRRHFTEVEIRDNGQRAENAPTRAGLGIVGMRERARALGGILQAGPGADGGWVVTLRLPREERRDGEFGA